MSAISLALLSATATAAVLRAPRRAPVVHRAPRPSENATFAICRVPYRTTAHAAASATNMALAPVTNEARGGS